MEISVYTEKGSMENPHGIKADRLYSSDFAEIIHIQLDAGDSLVKHITPVDVVFYVLEGSATIEIGDETEIVPADRLVQSPKRVPHKISNNSDGILRVLVMKLPKPTEATKIIKE